MYIENTLSVANSSKHLYHYTDNVSIANHKRKKGWIHAQEQSEWEKISVCV